MTVNMLAGRARAGRAVILAALAALLLPLLAVPGAMPARASSGCATAVEPSGDGSEGRPYLIASPGNLVWLSDTSTAWDGKYFLQTADIDMAGCDWTPIAWSVTSPLPEFTGHYDGGGFSITNLSIEKDENNLGMFGFVNGGSFRNLGLEVKIRAGVRTEPCPQAPAQTCNIGGRRVGGLIAEGSGVVHVQNVSVTADIDVPQFEVGGLIGYHNDATGAVTVESVTLDVRLKADLGQVGGVMGEHWSGSTTLRDVHVNIEMFGPSGGNAGGMIGEGGDDVLIERSSVAGSIVVDGRFNTGGIYGDFYGSGMVISQSVSSVSLSSTSTSMGLGGILGTATGGSTAVIIDSLFDGSISGAQAVGGLSGNGTDFGGGLTVINSYSVGSVTTSSTTVPVPAGGLIGTYGTNVATTSPPTVSGSFFDVETAGLNTSEGGTGLSTELMKTLATFTDAGWDISRSGCGTVWVARDGVYPALRWTAAGAQLATGCPPAPVAPSFVAPGGVLPALPAGVGAWVQADGSSTPLAVSSPGVNQLRYAADGIEVTFTGGSGSSVSNGLVADANGEVVCEVCVQLAAGQVIEVWMFSTPRLVAAHLTEDLPCQRFSVPVVAPLDGGGPVSAGAHTLQLALPTSSGMQAVNVGVTVGGPVPASVPAGEGSVPSGAALFLLLGAVGVLVGRRALAAG